MAEKYTEAQKMATLKYQSKTVAVQIRLTSERREAVRQAAEASGMSLAKYITTAIDEKMSIK